MTSFVSAILKRAESGLIGLGLSVIVMITGVNQASAIELLQPELSPALEARYQAMAGELRCLVCQNQTLADSGAGLARDLKREVRERLKRGMSDEQIIQYLTDRYGDFILYSPPLKSSTLLLWFGPLLLSVAATVVLLRRALAGRNAAATPRAGGDGQRPMADLQSRGDRHAETIQGDRP